MLLPRVTWMKPKNRMFKERSQREKSAHHMTLFISNSRTRKLTGREKSKITRLMAVKEWAEAKLTLKCPE